MAISFSVAAVNWTNDDDPSLGGDISLEQCLTEMREAGFAACELGNKFPKDIGELKDCLSRFGLSLTTDWIGTTFTVEGAFQSSLQHFRERVEFLANFGVRALKVCECGHGIQQTNLAVFHSHVAFSKNQRQLLIKGLTEAAIIAADFGMYIAYHHHLGTGVQNKIDIDWLMQETDEKLVSLLPDTGHLFAAGVEPYDIFSRYIDRIKYVHLKDVRPAQLTTAYEQRLSFMDAIRAGLFTVPGDGAVNFKPIFDLLKIQTFDGYLVVEAEQDPKLAPPLRYAQMAREFLRQHFNQ